MTHRPESPRGAVVVEAPCDRYRPLRYLALAAGFLLSVVMVLRAQVGQDQLELLLIGWEFWKTGTPLPYGGGMSSGGLYPGSLTSVLHGLPLFLVQDFRAVGFATLLTHVTAYMLLDRALAPLLSHRERLLFCLLYWLNPWRIYFSAHVWNPNWLFVLGALHFLTAFHQRRRASLVASALHVLAIGLALQLHASPVLLVAATALLVLRGCMRVSWPGVALGAGVLLLSLIPYVAAVFEHPEILPLESRTIGRGALLVYPLLRGVLYWVRYGSLGLGQDLVELDFAPVLGADVGTRLGAAAATVLAVVGTLSIVPALAANVWFWRQGVADRCADRAWLGRFIRLSFLGALLTFAASPTTIMLWQVLVLFHVAILPCVLWLGRPNAGPGLRGLSAVTVGLIVVVATMSVASPMYRRGGRSAVAGSLREPHPMVAALNIGRLCTVHLDPRFGLPADPVEIRRWSLAGRPDHTAAASTRVAPRVSPGPRSRAGAARLE